MCILFFSIKTTNLTLCRAVVRKSTRSVREYGFPFSKWSLVPNHGWRFLVIETKTPALLWADLQNSGYNWNQCRLSLRDLQPLQTDALVVKRLFWLPTSQMNCLPILPQLLECFVSAQIIILQSSAWLFKNCKTWANAWSKVPTHIDTVGFVHAQYWGLKELSSHSP